MGKTQIIVFTDLDGTMIDRDTYSFEVATPLIKELKKKGIPLVFCTAKTKTENEYYQKKLKVSGPLIVENGGAIFIPKKYFSSPVSRHSPAKAGPVAGHHGKVVRQDKDYYIIELGAKYKDLRKALKEIKKETGFDIIGFGDMTNKEVAKDTGLTLKMAERAKQKQYNESFNFNEPAESEKILFKKIKQKGFNSTHGGRYYNIFGKNTDKGKAVKALLKIFKKEFGRITTIGLGDSLNDLPMLEVVDIPILVQKPNKKWESKIKVKNLIKINAIGPHGWVKAIKKYAFQK